MANMNKKLNYHLWVEKFRPVSVKDMVLPKKMKDSMLTFIRDSQIPNLLLYSSSPGSGKTTLAKALCADLDADFLYINISSENGIDTLRTKISRFASTRSMEAKQKIIIMDEFEGASSQLQLALRAEIEAFHSSCRFILTCNFVTKIIQPIRSRCQEFDMNYSDAKTVTELKPKINKHITNLLKFQEVETTPEILSKLVDIHYPDMRKMIQVCQQYSVVNKVIDEGVFNIEKVDTEFYDLVLQKSLTKARTYIIERGYSYDELYSKMFREFVPMLPNENKPQAIISLAEYQYKNAFVVDRELNFAACLIEIMKDL